MYANADLQYASQSFHERARQSDAAPRAPMSVGNLIGRAINWMNSGWTGPNRNGIDGSTGTDFALIHGHVVPIAASREETGADAYSM
jgi:hypothetical protein